MTDLAALDRDKLVAALDMLRRVGAVQVQIRYSDDEEPTVWMVVAMFADARWDVAAAREPVGAAMRLLETLVDGGRCNHCGRPSGITDTLDAMPLNALVCWYQLDPELNTFRRACEGETEPKEGR